jgi:putative NADH-flavin reductase
MQVTIFGASGKVGRLVVDEALQRGYHVTAVIHRSNPFLEDPRLHTKQGDIHDLTFVTQTLQGSDAAISCLGSWGTKNKNIVSTGTANIVPAMQELNMQRLITLTGAGALWQGDAPTLFDKLSHRLLSMGAGQILADGEKHLAILEESNLTWTCIRSPIMTKSYNDRYILSAALAAPWTTIPRRAVVRCLVDQLENDDFIRQAPVIRKP